MSASTLAPYRATSGSRLAVAAVAGVSLGIVYAAVVSFTDADPDAWRQFAVLLGLVAVAAALAFAAARGLCRREGPGPVARGSLVLAGLTVLSLLVFWASIWAPLAAASVALAAEARVRAGRWTGGPVTAVALSAAAVALAGVAAVIG
jgi:hypothetical protein